MGHRVIKCEDDSRYIDIRSIHFWAFDDNRTFTSAYWMHDDTDFPADWKTMGFSWDNSYEEWKSVFERLGYEIEVTKRPIQKDYRDREDLKAEFIAVSSDKNLMFTMVFGYGRDGCEDTSPRTLYSIFIDYTGLRR